MATFEDPGDLSPQDWPGAPPKMFEYINRTLRRVRDFLRTRLSLSTNIDCDVKTVRCSHGVEVRVPTRLTAVRGMMIVSASKGQQIEYARLVCDGAKARVTVFFAAGAGTAADVTFIFLPEGSGDGAGLAYTSCLRPAGGVLPIVNGGTGSATQNFVDLSTPQSVGGAKTFTGTTFMISQGAQQAFLDMEHTAGAATKKRCRIIYDGAVALTNPGWVFQNIDDASGFVANLVTISRAASLAAARVSIGILDPRATLDVGGALVSARVVLAYGATIATDASLGNAFSVTVNNGTAFTMSNPTNLVTGQRVLYTFRNTSGGAMGADTWGATFKKPALTMPATGNSRSVEYLYDGTNLIYLWQSPADVPN